jgi:deoxyribonuclease-4
MSIAGGLHTCLERGAAHGCDVVQLFTKSNQQWQTKPIRRGDLDEWQAQRASTGVEPALVHDSYLINLASPDPSLWRRSVRAFADEYARCGLLGVPALVFHPGAHVGSGATAGMARVAKAINRVCDEQTDNPTRLLMENTAGQGTSLGWRFEELRDIFAAIAAPDRVGVCVDTCHMFAAGYELRTGAGWHATLAAIERTVGLGRVRAFHVNDSKTPCGSRVDRHEHIGRGTIGLSGFRRVVNEPCFHDKPMVLETPKPTDWADRINLAVLRSLVGRTRVTAVAQRLARQSLQQPPELNRGSGSGTLSASGQRR